MVVYDVQDDGKIQRVGPIDEPAEVVGSTVAVIRGKQIDTVVTPAE